MFIAYLFVHCHVICNSPVYGGNKEYLLTNLLIFYVKALINRKTYPSASFEFFFFVPMGLN